MGEGEILQFVGEVVAVHNPPAVVGERGLGK
jgi:hypothetical protein